MSIVLGMFLFQIILLALINNQSFTNLALYIWLIYNLLYSTYQPLIQCFVLVFIFCNMTLHIESTHASWSSCYSMWLTVH